MHTTLHHILLAILIFSGCESSRSVLIIHNSSWPDGSCITLFTKNRPAVHTTLYGDHVRFSVQNNSPYLVRVASPAYVTFLSDTLHADEGNKPFSPPLPIPRPRIGSWRLGCVLSQNLPDSLYDNFITIAHGSLTTISPYLLNNKRLTRIVSLAHAYGIEVTARIPVAACDTAQILSLADSAEVYCVDGIVIQPDSSVCASAGFRSAVGQLAASLHERGLTLAVQLSFDCRSESLLIPSGITEIMTQAPLPEMPDELRISFACTGILTSIPAEHIEEKIGELVKKRVPLSRISVKLTLSGFKFSLGDNGELEPEKPEHGEIQGLIRDSGGYGIVRLRDGSLRIGFKGSLYTFDDCEGTALKISILRTGMLSRSGGIHILYDGLGVKPDPGDFKLFSKSAGAP